MLYILVDTYWSFVRKR